MRLYRYSAGPFLFYDFCVGSVELGCPGSPFLRVREGELTSYSYHAYGEGHETFTDQVIKGI